MTGAALLTARLRRCGGIKTAVSNLFTAAYKGMQKNIVHEFNRGDVFGEQVGMLLLAYKKCYQEVQHVVVMHKSVHVCM